jgi:beta-phosphoglucomutase
MNQKKLLKAAIFDMDGVVITTCDLHEDAWKKAGAQCNFSWPLRLNFRKDVFGTVSADSAQLLFGPGLSNDILQQLIEAKDAAYDELLEERVTDIVVPGLIDFLKSLKGGGLKLALATSSRQKEAQFVLRSLGVWDIFDAVVDISQVTRAKPDPEIYLTALSKLQLGADECVAFEDSLSGVRSVFAANIPCVLVKTTMDEAKLAAHGMQCLHAVDDFQAMNADVLLTTILQKHF